jgi:hypothetical protein
MSFLDQLERLHENYPGGLTDPKWVSDVRGEGADKRVPQHRQALLTEAQELLSLKALDSLLSSQHFGQVWEQVLTVLRHSDLIPVAQFKQKSPGEEQRRGLAVAVRELLHGTSAYEPRFDRFHAAFSAAFGDYPRWEFATALSAIVHPTEHVCIEPTAFRKQLKASSSRRSVAVQPSSSGYNTLLNLARSIGNKLTEQGEVPRDLLDVRDFIVMTLKPIPKPRVVREKVAKPKKQEEVVEAEAEEEDD